MPIYEYRCLDCGREFEALRPVGASRETAACPQGHADTVRRLSLVARPRSSAPQPFPASSGGCCGGGCACSAN